MSSSDDDSKRAVYNAKKLLDEHPQLLWALSQNFEIPSHFKQVLEDETGLTWQEILMSLDPECNPP